MLDLPYSHWDNLSFMMTGLLSYVIINLQINSGTVKM